MKLMIFTFVLLVLGDLVLAQTPTTVPTIVQPAVEVTTTLAGAPIVAPPTGAPAQVQIPEWVSSLLTKVEAMPVVGPLVSKVMVYLPIVYAVLTALALFLIGVAKALAPIVASPDLPTAVTWVTAFQNGKFMYWLKYFSFLNAQKPVAQKSV
jgi:hypothetical protein